MRFPKLLLASGNRDKYLELNAKLAEVPSVKLLTTSDFGISLDVAEDGTTLEENSALKARAFFRLLGIPALADDTGLFVDALGGAPGVYSARYSGEGANYESNRKKLLKELTGVKERGAEFRTVICIAAGTGEQLCFEGICRGRISDAERGSGGFGYDALFVPDGYDQTFAEMPPEQKNSISHRGKALDRLIVFLRNGSKYPVEDSNL